MFITRASKQHAEKLRDRIGEFLVRHCGVSLSMEKTRITHVRDGFDFLGFHLQLGTGQRGKFVPKIKVPREAWTRAVFSLNEAMRWRPLQESAATRIVRGSAVVLGWSNYYKIAHDFRRAANWLDHHAYWIAAKALCRKLDLSTAQCLRQYGTRNCISLNGILTLRRAQDVQTAWRQQAPEPYRPGTGCYLEDVDWEVEFRMYDRRRPGSMDFKVFALFRDGYRCRQCGTRVTYENSEADHIKPICRFASYEQAHFLENIQTLCLVCQCPFGGGQVGILGELPRPRYWAGGTGRSVAS